MPDPDPSHPRTEYENLGLLACWHRRYNLGDIQPKVPSEAWLTSLAVDTCPRLGDLLEYWEQDGEYWLLSTCGHTVPAAEEAALQHRRALITHVLQRWYVILPVFMYDHSGLVLQTVPFSDPWDSGQVGYIVCALDKARAVYVLPDANWDTQVTGEQGAQLRFRERVTKALQAEVEVYSQYLSGDVWYYVCEEYDQCEDCGRGEWRAVDSCGGFYGSDPRTNGMRDTVAEEWRDLLLTTAHTGAR
jgi:hypothetical protein